MLGANNRLTMFEADAVIRRTVSCCDRARAAQHGVRLKICEDQQGLVWFKY